MRVPIHLMPPEVRPIPEATRLALNLRAGLATVHPLPTGNCELCGRGPRILAWSKEDKLLCVECAVDQCIECGIGGGFHATTCSEMAMVDLRFIEDGL